MAAHRNPITDKTRGARKRYGARAALWGMIAALYASGRDPEGQHLAESLRRGRDPEEVLVEGLALPDLGRAGEELIPWVAHRYYLAERAGNTQHMRWLTEQVIPRYAFPILDWAQRSRPRPNLFDMSIEEAADKARAFAESAPTRRKPPSKGLVVYTFPDGWTVQELMHRHNLVDEGNFMHTCVGQVAHGYPERVSREEIRIYSIRDPQGFPHATLTWDCDELRLTEASAAMNDPLSKELAARAVEFGRYKDMDNLQLLRAGLLYDARGIGAPGIDLSWMSLDGIDLSGADLSQAHLNGASLRDAKLIGTNLSGASLREACLFGADLTDAKLFGASLRNSEYDNRTKWPKNFDPYGRSEYKGPDAT